MKRNNFYDYDGGEVENDAEPVHYGFGPGRGFDPRMGRGFGPGFGMWGGFGPGRGFGPGMGRGFGFRGGFGPGMGRGFGFRGGFGPGMGRGFGPWSGYQAEAEKGDWGRGPGHGHGHEQGHGHGRGQEQAEQGYGRGYGRGRGWGRPNLDTMIEGLESVQARLEHELGRVKEGLEKLRAEKSRRAEGANPTPTQPEGQPNQPEKGGFTEVTNL